MHVLLLMDHKIKPWYLFRMLQTKPAHLHGGLKEAIHFCTCHMSCSFPCWLNS